MSKRRRQPEGLLAAPSDPLEQRVEQARRHNRRGEARKALILLRETCFFAGCDARLWVLYAMQSWRLGRLDDARQALRQALWLRERAHDDRRAKVIRALLAAAETGGGHTPLRAA